MSKKWMIENWNIEIKPVECVKETDKQAVVILNNWNGGTYERRMNKEGSLFDSFIDAKNYLIERQKRKISQIQASLDSAKAELKRRNDIPHPKG